MRLSTVVQVVAIISLAFLAGQNLGLTIPQQPLTQPDNDGATKISTLQSELTSRMIKHKTVMAAHFQNMSSTLTNISLSLGVSTLILSHYNHQLPNLQESDLLAFFEDLFNYLKEIRGDLKHDVGHGVDFIHHTLTLMINETDEMDLFLSQVLKELNRLESELKQGATYVETDKSKEYSGSQVPTGEEKESLEASKQPSSPSLSILRTNQCYSR